MTSNQVGKRGGRAKIAAWVTGGVLVALGGLYGVSYAFANSGLPRNTTVAGVDVGRMAHDEAVSALEKGLSERAAAPLTIRAEDKEITKTPAELGLAVDYEASIDQAGGSPGANPMRIFDALVGGQSYDAVILTDQQKLTGQLDELSQQVEVEPVDATLAYNKKMEAVVTESALGRDLSVEKTVEALEDAYLDEVVVTATVEEVDPSITTAEANRVRQELAEPAVASDIEVRVDSKTFAVTPKMVAASLTFVPDGKTLKPKIDDEGLADRASDAIAKLGFREPKSASFKFVDGKPVVVPSKEGKGVKPEELGKAVLGVLGDKGNRSVEVPLSTTKPSFSTKDAEKAGVKEITGEFTTYYPASRYRINNIGKLARMINGVYVAPGETFSMNETLGPRTTALGWMAGGAIDGGRLVERMGGGISQTTTTTFNAVFFAGLEIITHKPHSLYFSRYPMGREATLDYHSVDFKFRNDSDHGVLLQAFTNNPKPGGQGSITVRVWSTKTYTVKATKPVTSNYRSPGAVIEDNSKVCTPQSGMSGFRVDYKRQFYKDGKLVRTEPFTWTYNTLTPVKCVNPDRKPDRVVR